jgi:hypothetical protein
VRSYKEDKPPEDLKLFASDLAFDLSSLLPPSTLSASAPSASKQQSSLSDFVEPDGPGALKLPRLTGASKLHSSSSSLRSPGSPLSASARGADLFVDDDLVSKLDMIEERERQRHLAAGSVPSGEPTVIEEGDTRAAPSPTRETSAEELEAGRQETTTPTRIDEHELDRRPKRWDDGGGPPVDTQAPAPSASGASTEPTQIDEHELDRRPKRWDDGGGPQTSRQQGSSATEPTRIDEHELDRRPKRQDDGGGPPMDTQPEQEAHAPQYPLAADVTTITEEERATMSIVDLGHPGGDILAAAAEAL